VRDETVILQVNTGLLCNQSCRHCHLDAGPKRKENMNAETVDNVVDFAERCSFAVVDITGGAPELNPHLGRLIEKTAPLAPRIMLRSNLSALSRQNDRMLDLLKANRVVVIASFPSVNLAQSDSQRGEGIFEVSIRMLQKLNAVGYGRSNGDLELNLVSNPTGAFLPPTQQETEKRYHQVLEQRWGIVFNNLYSFANVPLGRFRQWLIASGNFDNYMDRLASNFNPCALEGLMCRSLVSVSWDGYLFDCDFNLARRLFLGGQKTHVSEMSAPPAKGSPISIGNHCYTCTAGSGFT
jgi:radical SAM/Cys-rich protein